VIDFLTRHMLRWEPQKRLSAAKCLRTASQIGLFDETILQTGNRTPQPEPDRGTNDNTEDASTIREPFWQDVRTSVRDEGDPPRSQGPSPSCIPEHSQVEEALGRVEPRNEDESTSLVSRERYNRAAKRRRTTNGFEPNVQFSGSFLRLGGNLLPKRSLIAVRRDRGMGDSTPRDRPFQTGPQVKMKKFRKYFQSNHLLSDAANLSCSSLGDTKPIYAWQMVE